MINRSSGIRSNIVALPDRTRRTANAMLLAGGASMLAFASAAHAQTPPAGAAPAPSAETAAADIVVTGSRVIQNGNNSPTPVTVVPTQQLLAVQPTTVVDAVNLAPALQGSQSLSSPPGGGQRNGAAAYFNLRGLGDLRTLVLMDGHRVVPTINAFGANVDSFVVPQLLIQRVDVVTGGVSAVYGSDAVTGVVNFITDRSFNGLKVQGQTGISKYGDAKQFDIGAAFGTRFAGGRGHFEASYQYRQDNGIPDQLQRPYFASSPGGAGLGTTASPYSNVFNSRLSTTAFGGLITNGTFANQQFATNGVLTSFNPGTPTGTAGVASGGDGAWYDQASLKAALKFHQFFGRVDYDVTDGMHAYLQGSGSINHSESRFRTALVNVTMSNSNPFVQAIPGGLGAAAIANPNGTFTFSKLYHFPPEADQYTRNYMIHGGLEGEFGGGYKWDVGFGQSWSRIRAVTQFNLDNPKYFAAVNAVRNSAGQIVCRASLTNANYANCVPLNPFGPTSESAEALDYVFNPTFNVNQTRLSEVHGAITGAPFSTWAGPVNMAVSAEFRRLSWSVTGNAAPSDPVDCAGIGLPNGNALNCTATTVRWLQTTQAPRPKVRQDVKEIAYEIDVPLASDTSFAKALNFNGAVRYTDYSTSGQVTTWKAGLIWRPIDGLLLRGTASRDIRAPNIFELFAPQVLAQVNLSDPFTRNAAGQNVTGQVQVATVSNPNLTPERTRSLTGGIVWSPSFIPHLTLTVDAYKITINNAITQLNGNSSLVQNLCASTQGNNPACAVIIRPRGWTDTTPANFPTLLLNQYLNIASYKTHGVDFEANYNPTLFGRKLLLRALASYQPKLEFNQGPAGVIQLANSRMGPNPFFGAPKFKYTLIGSYDVNDHLNLTVLNRGRGKMKVITVVEGQPEKVFLNGKDHDPATSTTNLTATFKFAGPGKHELFFNVQNLFNKQPDIQYAGANAQPGLGQTGFFPANGDDTMGRYYSVGFRSRF